MPELQSTQPEHEQPHIVELVLQAKKALQQGQELCLHASAVSAASAQTAVDVLALDAQVRWMSEAVLDQLKVRPYHIYRPPEPPPNQPRTTAACCPSGEEHRAKAL